MGLLIIPIFLVVIWAVMIRPQQKRMKEHRALLQSLEVGDEVVTSSGIYGMVTDFDGPTVFVEVADGVEVKLTRDSIAELVSYDDVADADADVAADES